MAAPWRASEAKPVTDAQRLAAMLTVARSRGLPFAYDPRGLEFPDPLPLLRGHGGTVVGHAHDIMPTDSGFRVTGYAMPEHYAELA